MKHLLDLGLILGVFLAMIVTMMTFTFRGRRLARETTVAGTSQGPSDARILWVIFGSILAAMALAVVAGYLVFAHG